MCVDLGVQAHGTSVSLDILAYKMAINGVRLLLYPVVDSQVCGGHGTT